ncbi:hypothetical protein BJX76DRAFT_329176 [Aspergillus varians]
MESEPFDSFQRPYYPDLSITTGNAYACWHGTLLPNFNQNGCSLDSYMPLNGDVNDTYHQNIPNPSAMNPGSDAHSSPADPSPSSYPAPSNGDQGPLLVPSHQHRPIRPAPARSETMALNLRQSQGSPNSTPNPSLRCRECQKVYRHSSSRAKHELKAHGLPERASGRPSTSRR